MCVHTAEWMQMGTDWCLALYQYLRREGECPAITAPTPQPQLFANALSPVIGGSNAHAGAHAAAAPNSPPFLDSPPPRHGALAAMSPIAPSAASPAALSLSPSTASGPDGRLDIDISIDGRTPKAAQLRIDAASAEAAVSSKRDVVVVAITSPTGLGPGSVHDGGAASLNAPSGALPSEFGSLQVSVSPAKYASYDALGGVSPFSALSDAMGGMMTIDSITAQLINLDQSGALTAATENDDAGSDDNPSGDEMAPDIRARRVKDMQNGVVSRIEPVKRKKKRRSKGKAAPKGRGESAAQRRKNAAAAASAARKAKPQPRPKRVSRPSASATAVAATSSSRALNPTVAPLRSAPLSRVQLGAASASTRRTRSVDNLAELGATRDAGQSPRARMLLRASYAYRRSNSESSGGRASPSSSDGAGAMRPRSGGSAAAVVDDDYSDVDQHTAMLRLQRRQITFAPDFVETPSVLSKSRPQGVIIRGHASPRADRGELSGGGKSGGARRGGGGGSRSSGSQRPGRRSTGTTPHSSSLRSRFLRVIESRGPVEVRGARGSQIPSVHSGSSAATEISAARAQVSTGSPPAPPRSSVGRGGGRQRGSAPLTGRDSR